MSQQSSTATVAAPTSTAASSTNTTTSTSTSANNFFQSITSTTPKSQSQAASSSSSQEQGVTEIYRAGRRNRWTQHTSSSTSPSTSLNQHELGVDNVENFFQHHQQQSSQHHHNLNMNSNPHVNRRLLSPWLWYHRPIDTRHLPTPRPLPPIYSDVHRLRSSSIELQRPWQRYTHIFTIGLCTILVPYMLLYMPIQEDDFMLPFRRWVFGEDYKATNVKSNTMKT